jgi:hypothetical protein
MYPTIKPQKPDKDKKKRNREAALDKTLADSFPASDPPSSIPDPAESEPLEVEEDSEKHKPPR